MITIFFIISFVWQGKLNSTKLNVPHVNVMLWSYLNILISFWRNATGQWCHDPSICTSLDFFDGTGLMVLVFLLCSLQVFLLSQFSSFLWLCVIVTCILLSTLLSFVCRHKCSLQTAHGFSCQIPYEYEDYLFYTSLITVNIHYLKSKFQLFNLLTTQLCPTCWLNPLILVDSSF